MGLHQLPEFLNLLETYILVVLVVLGVKSKLVIPCYYHFVLELLLIQILAKLFDFVSGATVGEIPSMDQNVPLG